MPATTASHPRKHDAQLQMLRAVASLELLKGVIVLAAAFGIVFLVHKDPWDVADSLIHLLHISPDGHFAHRFLEWADTLTDAKLWTVAAAALAYSILRFVEGYGLWHARAWAEWIALISGSLYLPFEIVKLVHRQSLFHVGLFVVNLAVVLYMAYLLKTGKSVHGLGTA